MSETVTASAPASAPATSQAQTSSSPAQANTGAQGAPSPQAQTQSGAQGGETKAQTQERILAEQDLDAYIEHKVNGKVERVKVRDLQKAYGLDKTANQRMQEAAQIKKQQQQLVHLFQNDFDKFCEATGINKADFLRKNLSTQKEIAEEILAAEYERAQMSPEARRALELEQELNQFKTRDSEAKKPIIAKIREIVPESQLPKGLENATAEQLQEFYQAKQQEFTQGVDNFANELLEAWQAQGLPRQKEFGQWMAQVMMDHQKRTGESLQPSEAAAKVKARFLKSTQSLLSQMDAKAIQETLGEEILKKLRDYDVSRVTQSGPQFGVPNDQAPQAVNEPKKYLNQVEWRKAQGLG